MSKKSNYLIWVIVIIGIIYLIGQGGFMGSVYTGKKAVIITPFQSGNPPLITNEINWLQNTGFTVNGPIDIYQAQTYNYDSIDLIVVMGSIGNVPTTINKPILFIGGAAQYFNYCGNFVVSNQLTVIQNTANPIFSGLSSSIMWDNIHYLKDCVGNIIASSGVYQAVSIVDSGTALKDGTIKNGRTVIISAQQPAVFNSTIPMIYSTSSEKEALFKNSVDWVMGGLPPSCTNDCTPSGSKTCTSTTAYKTCGNYDADSCLEYSSITACPTGQSCSGAGVCSIQSNCTSLRATVSNSILAWTSNPTTANKQTALSSITNWAVAC